MSRCGAINNMVVCMEPEKVARLHEEIQKGLADLEAGRVRSGMLGKSNMTISLFALKASYRFYLFIKPVLFSGHYLIGTMV